MVEVLEGLGFVEASAVEASGAVIVLAALDLVGEHEFEEGEGQDAETPQQPTPIRVQVKKEQEEPVPVK